MFSIIRLISTTVKAPYGKLSLLSAFAVSMNAEDWTLLKYGNIKTNQIKSVDSSLFVNVASSASPLVYNLDSVKNVSGFKINFSYNGLPNIVETTKQGAKGYDDALLRVGFVVSGKRKLNFVERLLAPSWIKDLTSSKGSCTGIMHVKFFNVMNAPGPSWKQRSHPMSDYFKEINWKQVSKKEGSLVYSESFAEPMKVCALWLSLDGDDTKSDFEVNVNSFSIEEVK